MKWWQRFIDRFTKPKPRPAADPMLLKLKDGTEARITGYSGPNLVSINESGHVRLVFSYNTVSPEDFWTLWRHLSGKTLTWADGTVYEGTEIGPTANPIKDC